MILCDFCDQISINIKLKIKNIPNTHTNNGDNRLSQLKADWFVKTVDGYNLVKNNGGYRCYSWDITTAARVSHVFWWTLKVMKMVGSWLERKSVILFHRINSIELILHSNLHYCFEKLWESRYLIENVQRCDCSARSFVKN